MVAVRLAAGVAALILSLAAAAAAAQARPPVLITTSGQSVGIAVDAQGTTHIAYNDPNPDGVGEPLMYCAWPKTARTCTPRPILVDNDSPLGQPPLIQAGPAPGQLTIVSSRDAVDVIRSADGGANWSAPTRIGTGRWFEGAFGPNGQLGLSFPNLGYVEFYERSLAGSPADTATADLNHGHSVNAVTGFSGSVPVLVSGGTTIRTAVSSGSGQGDGPRHAIPFGGLGLPPVIGPGMGQDANGRMAIAWFNAVRDRIEVSASKTGAHWTRARVLATGATLPGNIRVGLGPDGRGLVVWDDNGDKKIKAVKVDAPALIRHG